MGRDPIHQSARGRSYAAPGWQIRFADNVDTFDPAAREAVLLSAWEARRWNIAALAVPGLPDTVSKPNLTQRRALAVAALLKEQGVRAKRAPPAGQVLTLAPGVGVAP